MATRTTTADSKPIASRPAPVVKSPVVKSAMKTPPPSPRRKVTQLQPLGSETLGQKLRRAYKAGQARRPGLTYRGVADLIRPFHNVSDATIVRWEKDLYDVESTPRRILVKVWFCLVVYGVDPADLGITLDVIGLDPGVAERAISVLTPSSACLHDSAA